MTSKKNLKIIIFFLLSAVLIFPVAVLWAQSQSVDSNFDPNKLIDDKVFSDTQTFGSSDGIQKFLEKKNSVLAHTENDFLQRLKEPDSVQLKTSLEDPRPNLGRLRTAAELIWDASRQSGINPQVILVTLNKEQGLITAKTDPAQSGLQRALDFAMGFGCPDSTGCSASQYGGFYFQLFGTFDASGNRYLGAAKSLMKSFGAVGGRGPLVNGLTSKVGDTIVLPNTLGGYENIASEQTVTLNNNATAALYRYTPHIFNGNYNFWKYFQSWFKYPNGTLIKLSNASEIYIIQNGQKLLVPQFVAMARNLNISSAIVASPTEFESYETDKPLGPSDNTVVTLFGDSKKYVFLENIKHPASDLVINQRGLSQSTVLTVSESEAKIFQDGSVLTPKDGTVLKGQTDKTVFLAQNGKILQFSSLTFQQRKIKSKDIFEVPDKEILSYTKNGFVPPLEGSVVKLKNQALLYLIESGLKKPILPEIYSNRKIKTSQIGIISEEELAALTVGSFAPPKDRTFFAVGSSKGDLYIFKEGTKHAISKFVSRQRGITPDIILPNRAAITWYDGIPIPPKDGSIIKGDSDATVYLVSGGQLKPLTPLAFKNRKITAKKITILPQAEVDAYGKGEAIEK